MTNEEYFQLLKKYTDGIVQCRKQVIDLFPEVIGENLLGIDFCYIGLLDRSIHLADGFIALVVERNLTCAGALLRLQIDNCLRTLAICIAENENEIVDCVLKGNNISKLKDKEGNKLQDFYLVNKLKEYDKRVDDVYRNASGFIHFSSKAFYQTVEECQDETIKFHFGGELSEKFNVNLLECAEAYLHYYKLFIYFMTQEAKWKTDFDKKVEE